jgi:hypothetical protein
MTYDPNNPNLNRRTEMDLDDRRVVRDTGGMSGATMAAIAVAALLFLGVIFWAFMGGERQTATTTTNPPATTGQRAPTATPPAAVPAPKQVPERAPTTPTTPPAPK